MAVDQITGRRVREPIHQVHETEEFIERGAGSISSLRDAGAWPERAAKPRAVWIMVPAGEVTRAAVDDLAGLLRLDRPGSGRGGPHAAAPVGKIVCWSSVDSSVIERCPVAETGAA